MIDVDITFDATNVVFYFILDGQALKKKRTSKFWPEDRLFLFSISFQAQTLLCVHNIVLNFVDVFFWNKPWFSEQMSICTFLKAGVTCHVFSSVIFGYLWLLNTIWVFWENLYLICLWFKFLANKSLQSLSYPW